MTRFDADSLVEETLGELSGHTLSQEQFTWLSGPIDDSVTTIPVQDQTQIRRGIAEIGDELVLVNSSETGGSVLLAPFGRGYLGTEKQSWPADTRVSFGPRFPRYRIKQKINDLVRSVYPQLFAVGTTTFDASSPAFITYELPADVEDVLTVKQQTLGPSRDWIELTRWRFDRAADVSEFSNGRSIDIDEPLTPGRPIQVTYVKRPTPMESEWSDTGLNDSAWPAVMYGVLHQLVASVETGITGLNSVKAAEAQRRRGHSPTELSLQYYRVHVQLLREERDRLLMDHEVTANFELN